MSGWKEDKNLGPWPFIAQPDKPNYNQGNYISPHDNPVWDLDRTGEQVTVGHAPWCGYWTKDYVPFIPTPPSTDKLFSAGYDLYGRTGLGLETGTVTLNYTLITPGDWSMIACGSWHGVAIKGDGTLWGWGYNNYGQLAQGDQVNRSIPTLISSDSWATIGCTYHGIHGVKTDGTLWVAGYGGAGALGTGDQISVNNTLRQVGSATDWNYVVGGNLFSLALKTDGTAWATGTNTFGQLGLGDTTLRTSYVQIGSDTWTKLVCGRVHAFGIKSSGLLFGWGVSQDGELGLGAQGVLDGFYTSPQQVGSSTWIDISGGYFFSNGIKTGNTLWSTGTDLNGELGLGGSSTEVFTQVGSAFNWLNCYAIDNSAYAINQTGNLFSTGLNNAGALGLGDQINRDTFTQVGTDLWEMISTRNNNFSVGLKQ